MPFASRGVLSQHWSAWFDGLEICYEASGTTVLRGPLVDEAALHGVLSKVRDLALPLISVNREQVAHHPSGIHARWR